MLTQSHVHIILLIYTHLFIATLPFSFVGAVCEQYLDLTNALNEFASCLHLYTAKLIVHARPCQVSQESKVRLEIYGVLIDVYMWLQRSLRYQVKQFLYS